jgi:hypothetical protein
MPRANRYQESVRAVLQAERLCREACWTESLAVGGERIVYSISSRIANRMKVETVQLDGAWLVRETPTPYMRFSASKNSPKMSQPLLYV